MSGNKQECETAMTPGTEVPIIERLSHMDSVGFYSLHEFLARGGNFLVTISPNGTGRLRL
jgi:hypothetical protein